MDILNVLTVNKGEKISIVGAGGKTTLMFILAEELKKRGRVLITTTTKIHLPKRNQYNCLILKDSFEDYINEESKYILNGNEVYVYYGDISKTNESDGEIHVYGSSVNIENKVIGIDDKSISNILNNYDYILIESDGAKEKTLKAWKEDEPVVSNFTSTTIGVLSGEALNLKIDDGNIHRIDEFLKLINKSVGDSINEEDLLGLIFKKEGLFKNSKGRRILFINKVEEEDFKKLENLIENITMKNKELKLLDGILIGSLLNKTYRVIYEESREKL
ncbi:selenium cofactor biosynthesis protein YqeC [Clostridium sp. UBA4395]|uniref:selenium cofactor biosynthesis protein YqeC n=1 Tax=Clostridium sp. UBA4395 TaxID=1946360 RepID=UPI0032177A83